MEQNVEEKSQELSDSWTVVDEVPSENEQERDTPGPSDGSDGESVEVIEQEDDDEVLPPSEYEDSVPINLDPGPKERKYVHRPNKHIDTALNMAMLITASTVIGLAIGHYMGYVEEINKRTDMMHSLQNENNFLKIQICKLIENNNIFINKFASDGNFDTVEANLNHSKWLLAHLNISCPGVESSASGNKHNGKRIPLPVLLDDTSKIPDLNMVSLDGVHSDSEKMVFEGNKDSFAFFMKSFSDGCSDSLGDFAVMKTPTKMLKETIFNVVKEITNSLFEEHYSHIVQGIRNETAEVFSILSSNLTVISKLECYLNDINNTVHTFVYNRSASKPPNISESDVKYMFESIRNLNKITAPLKTLDDVINHSKNVKFTDLIKKIVVPTLDSVGEILEMLKIYDKSGVSGMKDSHSNEDKIAVDLQSTQKEHIVPITGSEPNKKKKKNQFESKKDKHYNYQKKKHGKKENHQGKNDHYNHETHFTNQDEHIPKQTKKHKKNYFEKNSNYNDDSWQKEKSKTNMQDPKIRSHTEKDSSTNRWHNDESEQKQNISGDWAINMGKGRATIRMNEHKSDWIFERAYSRRNMRSAMTDEDYWYFQRAEARKECRKRPTGKNCKTNYPSSEHIEDIYHDSFNDHKYYKIPKNQKNILKNFKHASKKWISKAYMAASKMFNS